MSDLTAAAVERELARLGAPFGPVSVVALTGSTNDDARAAAARGAPHGAAFLADTQTAGRGRGGHAWHSPPGENLYMSMILRTRVPAASVAPVTLAVGLAVATVVEARLDGLADVRIKWPNDVYAAGRKLAGVLVEGQLRGAEVVSLVAGVGVNVRTVDFPPELAARAASLRSLGAADLDRATLAAELLAAIGAAVARFEREGLGGALVEIARRDFLLGRRLEAGGVAGTGAGIDADGRLLVRTAAGAIVAVSSGEVTVTFDP